MSQYEEGWLFISQHAQENAAATYRVVLLVFTTLKLSKVTTRYGSFKSAKIGGQRYDWPERRLEFEISCDIFYVPFCTEINLEING